VAQIRPFAGVRFSRHKSFDLSNLIAPPYDVLDDAGKAALQAKHPNNIVTVDLPHLPAKSVGPDETYAKAAATVKSWLAEGILERDAKPAIYPYAQTYTHAGRTFHRRGMIALVKLSPFGEGHVVPHEKTYPDAIADRLKLTRATKMQLSPIFGLFSDPRSEVTGALFKNTGKPEVSATLDNVRNDLWSVNDSSTENTVIDAMSARPVYIADGHHRYTMALQYQKEITEQHGGPLPPQHPANYCMFVLVGMQDDGLLILPTHRLIGSIPSFDINAFKAVVAPVATVSEVVIPEADLPRYIDVTLPRQAANTFGLFDGRTRKTYQVSIIDSNILKTLEPDHSDSWRKLDVAILQSYLLDQVLKPHFADGADPTRGYTADSAAVAAMTDGNKYQIALLLKSTPLHALEELGKTKEVMPQKSTYFFPKLATGMVMSSLE
jgi:uncharacterized protein (DUF1015 family)